MASYDEKAALAARRMQLTIKAVDKAINDCDFEKAQELANRGGLPNSMRAIRGLKSSRSGKLRIT